MASIHKQPGKPFWFCAYYDVSGKRRFRSTKTADKKQARKICNGWARAAEIARAGKLTPDRAREVVESVVADIFTDANSEDLPSASVRGWCKSWLERKQMEAESATHSRYTAIVEHFLAWLGDKAEKSLSAVRVADVAGFRDATAKTLSRNSANLSVKVLRACFNAAVKQGLLTTNPASPVEKLKMPGESKRRPFTVAEIKRVLDRAGDSEWRGMVLFGLYTGQRLGDVARLTWRAVDLQRGEVAFITRKTGKRLVLPLARPLVDYLAELDAPDSPDAPLFPKLSAVKRTGQLSNFFRDEILVAAGLAAPRSHKATGRGRYVSRAVSELSFHSLRHSAVTFLKAAGASDALARAIVGHESEAVSRAYTHLDTEHMRDAVSKLPDVTREK